MKKDFENKKELVNDRNLIPTPCGRGSSCASEASYKCRGGVLTRHCEEDVVRRGNLLSGLLRHFVVMDFDNSQKRGFARLYVLGGLRRAAHLSKSAPRNDEYRSGNLPTLTLPLRWGGSLDGNSATPQSLLKVKNLKTCASELRARFDGVNDVVIADVNRSPVKCERARNRLNVLTTLRKAAFTLAEVLVTLGVIGVVAAMTIPTLINKIDSAIYKSAYKKAYSTINNAYRLAEIDKQVGLTKENICYTRDDGTCSYSAGYRSIADVFKILSEYIKTTKTCFDGDTSGCWECNGQNTSGRALPPDYVGGACGKFTFIDSSGMTWFLRSSVENIIVVDVNGFKKPNVLGKDRYILKFAESLEDKTDYPDKPTMISPWKDMTTKGALCPSGDCPYASFLFD